MAAAARRVVVLADRGKVGADHFARFADVAGVDLLVTDAGLGSAEADLPRRPGRQGRQPRQGAGRPARPEEVAVVLVPVAGSIRANVSVVEPGGTVAKLNEAGPVLAGAGGLGRRRGVTRCLRPRNRAVTVAGQHVNRITI